MHSCGGYIHKGKIISDEDISRYNGQKAIITILEESEESAEGAVFSQLYAALDEWQNLKNRLIRRLDQLLQELEICTTMHNKERVRGNCNEIELMLMEQFGMRREELELVEKKAIKFKEYSQSKYGGYHPKSEDGVTRWLKDGKILNPNFKLVDNGVGDMRAVEATREFQSWLKETGITELDWMLEAEIIYPAIIQVMDYSFTGFDKEMVRDAAVTAD